MTGWIRWKLGTLVFDFGCYMLRVGWRMLPARQPVKSKSIPTLPGLDSCPFCGTSKTIDLLVTERLNGRTYEIDGYHVSCFQCGAAGPVSGTSVSAQKAWDARSYTLTTERTLYPWLPIDTAPQDAVFEPTYWMPLPGEPA